jgi:hypothetical protein
MAVNSGLRRKRKSRPYRRRGRHFRGGARAAAARAFCAAKLYLGLPIKTGRLNLSTASVLTGSNPAYTEAASVILQCRDTKLIDDVLSGRRPILSTAKQLRNRAKLFASYQNATGEDLAALGRAATPHAIFDDCVMAAL